MTSLGVVFNMNIFTSTSIVLLKPFIINEEEDIYIPSFRVLSVLLSDKLQFIIIIIIKSSYIDENNEMIGYIMTTALILLYTGGFDLFPQVWNEDDDDDLQVKWTKDQQCGRRSVHTVYSQFLVLN